MRLARTFNKNSLYLFLTGYSKRIFNDSRDTVSSLNRISYLINLNSIELFKENGTASIRQIISLFARRIKCLPTIIIAKQGRSSLILAT